VDRCGEPADGVSRPLGPAAACADGIGKAHVRGADGLGQGACAGAEELVRGAEERCAAATKLQAARRAELGQRAARGQQEPSATEGADSAAARFFSPRLSSITYPAHTTLTLSTQSERTVSPLSTCP